MMPVVNTTTIAIASTPTGVRPCVWMSLHRQRAKRRYEQQGDGQDEQAQAVRRPGRGVGLAGAWSRAT